jgi:hypothetical protein
MIHAGVMMDELALDARHEAKLLNGEAVRQ